MISFAPTMVVADLNIGLLFFLGMSSLGVYSVTLGEYVGVTLISALIVALFFGGWLGPGLPGLLWFLLKTAAFIVLFILVRATLPRPRYDQLMAFGWKVMLPLALANLLITGAIVLATST